MELDTEVFHPFCQMDWQYKDGVWLVPAPPGTQNGVYTVSVIED